MRTTVTVTLDKDVAAAIEQLRRARRESTTKRFGKD